MNWGIIITFTHIFLLCALFALTLSYYLMWKIEKKRHIFALFFFLFTIFLFIGGEVNNLIFYDSHYSSFCLSFILIKAIFLFLSSCLFLYSTWRKNLQ